ncbi:TetR/AcrR family transcriptional regulator [Burkholderia pseudomallei]|uniref:TetR/AcrR family transcriptional regulator n=1 Tax=Burkholderia pseudomallei TaxID=28450 RepID=UPI0015FEB943|nr:TetR/AcrR family transcriptional regulator [Burkholderia pseudomallei]
MINNMIKNLASEPVVRLSGADATKAAIVDAARRLFSIAGYRSTSVRAIAKEARIDPALIIRYFGSKEDLFLEALAISDFCEIALAGPLEGMGSRIVLEMISGDIQNKLGAYVSLMQASDSEAIRFRLRDIVRTGFVTRLAQRLTGKDAELRAHLISAQIGGLINSMAVIQHEVLLTTPVEIVARYYGAAIQLLIDGGSSGRSPPRLHKSLSGKK